MRVTEKEDLQAAARSRGLDDSGTIEDLRARVDAHDAAENDAGRGVDPVGFDDEGFGDDDAPERSDEDLAEAGTIVLRDHEDRMEAAKASADADAIADAQEDYHDARLAVLDRRRARAAQREQDENGGDAA